MSSSKTFSPTCAMQAATLTAVVVFPTPPFWLATAMTFVGTRRFKRQREWGARFHAAGLVPTFLAAPGQSLYVRAPMNEVLVIGHRNPDTDAICSAIGYAEFKRRTGLPNAIAARCGDTNERIRSEERRGGKGGRCRGAAYD